MSKRIILIVFYIWCSSLVFAQMSTQIHHYDYYNFSQQTFKPTTSIYVHQFYTDKLSFTAFSLLNDKWGEVLIGCEVKLLKSISFEVEAGMETNLESYGYEKNLLRLAGILSYVSGNISLTGIYEYGTINWFDVRVMYTFKYLSLGAMISEYYGYGPLLQYRFGNSPISMWGSYIYDWQTNEYGTMLGVRVSLKNKK